MAERRGACEHLPLPLLPLLIAPCGEAEEVRRGEERGINCTHSPTTRDYCAQNSKRKPPPEDVRTDLCRKKDAPGPRRRSGGPLACGGVLSRAWVGRLSSARGCHVARRRQAAGPQPGARANRVPPSNFKNFTKMARPTGADSQLLARQDKKLPELLSLHSTSMPNQLWGLPSE